MNDSFVYSAKIYSCATFSDLLQCFLDDRLDMGFNWPILLFNSDIQIGIIIDMTKLNGFKFIMNNLQMTQENLHECYHVYSNDVTIKKVEKLCH